MHEVIRICVGTEPNTELARKVLQHSIRQHTDAGVDIAFFPLTTDSGDAALAGLTGFSLQRWSIPERFRYCGRAIYLDADQLVCADIRELWTAPYRFPHPRSSVWCAYVRGRPQTSVMLIDCGRARTQWPTMGEIAAFLRPGQDRLKRYRQVMRGRLLTSPPVGIEAGWNHFDRFVPGTTRLLHFTNLRTQPWRYPEHPCAAHWGRALGQALLAKAVAVQDIAHQVAAFCPPGPDAPWGGGLHPHWAQWLAAEYGCTIG